MRKSVLLLFVFVFLIFGQIEAQTVTKYAGIAQTSGTDPVTGGILKDVVHFYQPYGIAIDHNNNIWISDKMNHSIKVIQKSDLKVYTRVGYTQGYKDATGVTSQFDNPMGLAIGLNNEIYVADNGNFCIRKISAFGGLSSSQTVTTFAGKLIGKYTVQGYADGAGSQAMFSSPTDIAVDATGNLYIADAGNNAIRKITTTGIVSTVAGGPLIPGYVDGTLVQAKFSSPTGICVTSNGDIYVADKGNSKIRKISGNNVTTIPITGLWSPDDVVVTTNGVMYITDQHKIIKYSGTISTVFAGSALKNDAGYLNGVGTVARFSNVKTMALRSSDNSLYVTDMVNQVIRQVILPTTSDIYDESVSPIKIYPSPAKDMIYLNPGKTDLGNASIMITSINGKINSVVDNHFIQDDVVQIPVYDLQPGIYILVIKTSKDLYRFRFIKQ